MNAQPGLSVDRKDRAPTEARRYVQGKQDSQ